MLKRRNDKFKLEKISFSLIWVDAKVTKIGRLTIISNTALIHETHVLGLKFCVTNFTHFSRRMQVYTTGHLSVHLSGYFYNLQFLNYAMSSNK